VCSSDLYRVGSILATQNRQLIAGDGKSEGLIFLELVSANARNVVLLPDLPFSDADYYSKDFGTRKFKKYSHSKSNESHSYTYSSHSKSYSVEEQPILGVTEISQQPFGTFTYKIVEDSSARKASQGKAKFVDAETLHIAKRIALANKRLDSIGIKASQVSLNDKLSGNFDSFIEELKSRDDI
jgi:hypothetical protein